MGPKIPTHVSIDYVRFQTLLNYRTHARDITNSFIIISIVKSVIHIVTSDSCFREAQDNHSFSAWLAK